MTIILNPGQEKQLNIALTPTPVEPATLFGSVTDAETGQPVAGALVQLSGGYSATTNSQGYYQIANIIPGVYSGQVTAAGYDLYTF